VRYSMAQRCLCAIVLALFALVPAVHARPHLRAPAAAAASSAPSPSIATSSSGEAALVEHGSYRNSSGQQVHSPAHSLAGTVPSGASAKCRDASYSFSRNHRGTCSHHGGVAAWL
jgi:hypothetical protein